MTPLQIEEAQRLAKEWESTYVQKKLASPGTWDVKPPTVLHEKKPFYTRQARKARIEGIVLIQCTIRKDGTADSFKTVRGLGYGLEESAIKTIAQKWRFKEGTFQGKPIDISIFIEVSYRPY